MTIKNAIYQVDNGSGFDEIHFKTKAEQVFCKSGKSIDIELEEKALDTTTSPTEDSLNSTKEKLNLMAGVGTNPIGLIVDSNEKSVRSFSGQANTISLGTVSIPWKDLNIGRTVGTTSIKTRTRWFTTYIAGITPAVGRVILPYPLGTDRASMIVIGGHVIKGNGVANAFTGIYYNPTTFEFDSVEAGRSYLVCIAILQE